MLSITNLITLVIAVVSGYTLSHSGQSIPKLQKYERKAEKAAEWSNTAEKQLWDTRYTVAVGFATTLISLLSALYYLVFARHGFSIQTIGWAALMSGLEYFASQYMRNFWVGKGKIPLVDDYNDAISHSQQVMDMANSLSIGWGIVTVLKVLGF